MKTEKQDRRMLCNDTTVSYFVKIQIFLRNLLVLSDWTKPLRGNVSPDLLYNA